eukprot:PhF_6_TR40468/c0_g1_i1/m.60484
MPPKKTNKAFGNGKVVRIFILSKDELEITSLDKYFLGVGEILHPNPVTPLSENRGYPAKRLFRIHSVSTENLVEILYSPTLPEHDRARLNFLKWGCHGVVVMQSVALEFSDICRCFPDLPCFVNEGKGLFDQLTSWMSSCVSDWHTDPDILDKPLRISIHSVLEKAGKQSILVGKIEQGTLTLGDDVLAYPQLLKGRVQSLQVNHHDERVASAGSYVGISLSTALPQGVRYILGPRRPGFPTNWSSHFCTTLAVSDAECFPHLPHYVFRMYVQTIDRVEIHPPPSTAIKGIGSGIHKVMVIGRNGSHHAHLHKVHNDHKKVLEGTDDLAGVYEVVFSSRVYVEVGEVLCVRLTSPSSSEVSDSVGALRMCYGVRVLPGEEVLIASVGLRSVRYLENVAGMKVVQVGSTHPPPHGSVVGSVLSWGEGKSYQAHGTIPSLIVTSHVDTWSVISHGLCFRQQSLTPNEIETVKYLENLSDEQSIYSLESVFAFEDGSNDRWIVMNKNRIVSSQGQVVIQYQQDSGAFRFRTKGIRNFTRMIRASPVVLKYDDFRWQNVSPAVQMFTYAQTQITQFRNTPLPPTHKIAGRVPYIHEGQSSPLWWVNALWFWSREPLESVLAVMLLPRVTGDDECEEGFVSLPRDLEVESVIPTILSFCYASCFGVHGYFEDGFIRYPPQHIINSTPYYPSISTLRSYFPDAQIFDPRYVLDKERGTVTAYYHQHRPVHVPGEIRVLWRHPFHLFNIIDIPPAFPLFKLKGLSGFPTFGKSGLHFVVPDLFSTPKSLTRVRRFYYLARLVGLQIDFIVRHPGTHSYYTLLQTDSTTCLAQISGDISQYLYASVCRVFYVPPTPERKCRWSLTPPSYTTTKCPECGYEQKFPDVQAISTECLHIHRIRFPWNGELYQFEAEMPWWADPEN